MGKRNREKRAAKKRARQRQSPHSEQRGPEYGWAPPAPDPEELADTVLGIAVDYFKGDPAAPADGAALLCTGPFAKHRRVVETAAGIALVKSMRSMWRGGWLPVDLWEHTRRSTDPTTTSLLVDAIADDVARHAAATVHERWAAQVRQLEATTWWAHDRPHIGQWAQRHGVLFEQALFIVITLIAELMTLPSVPQIVPPPGTATRKAGASVAGVDQKVLARVRGLLAKAESTQFPEEAEALSAKAQELMNRYAFERALLDADTHKPQLATSARLWLDSPYLEAKSHLVAAIARANRCRSVFYSKLGFLALVGEELDLEITELLATSLLVQATRAMVAEGSHQAYGTSRTRSFRRSFLISYAARIGERLDEANAQAHDPVEDARLLPVLADRSRVVDETFDAMFTNTISKSVSVSNGAGWQAGRAAADRADLNVERREVSA